MSFFDFVDAGELYQFHSAFFNVIEEFRPDATVEFHFRARDGSYLLLEATVNKLREVAAANIVLIYRDPNKRSPANEKAVQRVAKLIDEARTRDQRASELNEEALAKDRFIAMLSHELRTPLSPISLGVDDLREDERFVEARPTLAMIRRNIDLQARLLEDLFDFTKIGQHKVRMRLEPVDAHEAVGFVLEICKAEVTAAKIEVILDLAAPEKIVVADAVRLQHVMWNLVKNAIKFSTPGSSISINSANDDAGGLTLQFVDHGVGIEPALLPLIFDPFRQGNHAKPHLSGGLGLGLFIAKGLVEAQGGTLTALSEGHGKGSTFSLRLTKTPAAPVPPPIE
jgi:signal transduction histidine kinase